MSAYIWYVSSQLNREIKRNLSAEETKIAYADSVIATSLHSIDSLNLINKELTNQLDSISNNINKTDNEITKIKYIYKNKYRYIDSVNANGLIELLTKQSRYPIPTTDTE